MSKTVFQWLWPVRVVILLLLVGASTATCTAKQPKTKNQLIYAMFNDSIVKNAVSDSILSIIREAKDVKASLIKMGTDSAKVVTDSLVTLSTKDVAVVKFIITEPQNYTSNIVVLGLFIPSFRLEFTAKKRTLSALFDFGLGKWSLNDEKDVEICRYDLADKSMARFASALFPDDELLTIVSGKKEIKVESDKTETK